MSHSDNDKGEAPASPAVRLIHALSKAGGVLSCIAIVLILGVTAISVFNRYVIGIPLQGVEEATGYLVLAAVMFGAAETMRGGDHIVIDILSGRTQGRIRHYIGVWSDLSVFLFAAALLVAGWRSTRFSYDFGEYSEGYLEIAVWIPLSTLVVGAILLGLVSAARLANRLTRPADR